MGMGIYHIHQSQKGGITEKMNTIRKMKKNAKALSPVVASIILIAVTVAVSIAVAAWMGALVVGQMSTEEVKITNAEFGSNYIDLTVKNTGTSPVTLNEVSYVNGAATAQNTTDAIAANTQVIVRITGVTITDGYNYEMKLMSSTGNAFMYVKVAPAT